MGRLLLGGRRRGPRSRRRRPRWRSARRRALNRSHRAGTRHRRRARPNRWRRGRARIAALVFAAQKLARSHDAEHRRGLALLGRRERPSLYRNTRGRSVPLRCQADVPRVPLQAVAALLVEKQPHLRTDRGNHSQARPEGDRLNAFVVPGRRHRQPQPAAVQEQREALMLERELRRDERERLGAHVLEVFGRREREPALLRKHSAHRVEIDELQLNEVGPNPPAVDELGLERGFQLIRRNKPPLNQQGAEFGVRHVAKTIRRR